MLGAHPVQSKWLTASYPNTAVTQFLWLSSLPGWTLFLFTTGAMFLHGPNQQRALGFLLGLSAILVFLTATTRVRKRIVSPPRELILYSIWIFWCLTALAVARSSAAFWATYIPVLQVGLATVFTWILLRAKPHLVNAFLFGLLTGAAVQVIYIILSGEFVLHGASRVAGLSQNPNGLGISLLRTSIAAMLLLPFLPFVRRTRSIVLFGVLALLLYVVLLTGSRKSVLALGVLIGLWLLWAYPIQGRSLAVGARIALSFLFVFGLYFYLPWIVDNTLFGTRMMQFLDAGGGAVGAAAEQNIRYDMYLDGLMIFANHPLFGVGMGNFTQHFYTGHYSHSDFMEPLATTGLIGFLLYHAMHIGLTMRIFSALKVVKEAEARYRVKVCGIGLLTLLLIGTGAPFMTTHLHFMLLVSMWFVVAEARRSALLPQVRTALRSASSF